MPVTPAEPAASLAPQQRVDQRFAPRGLLRNTHVQSILPSLPPLRGVLRRRGAAVLKASHEYILDCGDGVRLQGFFTAAAGAAAAASVGYHDRLAVLLHGWEGSTDSPYVLSLSGQLHQRGFGVLRLNLRDHGATHHLNSGLFHSCRLPEVVGALRAIAAQFGGARLYLAGFSLGGNFMLRAAADAGVPANVAGVVAISPVLDPAVTLSAMELGAPVYRRYFVQRWSQSLRIKARAWPAQYEFNALLRTADLRHMTAELVARYTPFAGIADYLAGYAITGTRLASLRAPAALLLAQDDPIIPAADLSRLAMSPQLQVTVTPHGGHCGFFAHWTQPSFAESYILEQFARFDVNPAK